jgi:ApbE superfamily uncharacterized protein (UPF0280 family)
VVLSTSGATADAAATALCNMLRNENDLERVSAKAQEMADRGLGVVGLFAQAHGRLTVWGRVELTVL